LGNTEEGTCKGVIYNLLQKITTNCGRGHNRERKEKKKVEEKPNTIIELNFTTTKGLHPSSR